jgi:hypothetical protein
MNGEMEKCAQRGASSFALLAKYYCNEQVQEDEIDRACSAYMRGFHMEFL